MKSKPKVTVWEQGTALANTFFTQNHYTLETLIDDVHYEITRAFDLGYKAGAKEARAKLKAKRAK